MHDAKPFLHALPPLGAESIMESQKPRPRARTLSIPGSRGAMGTRAFESLAVDQHIELLVEEVTLDWHVQLVERVL